MENRKVGRPRKTYTKPLYFSSVHKKKYTSHSSSETLGKYVKFGTDDSFPNYLIKLYNGSSLHASCINAIVESLQGKSIEFNMNIEDKANEDETYYEVFTKLSLDFYLHGGFSYEVIWSNDRSSYSMYHIDFSYVRVEGVDSRGKDKGYYISPEFGKKGIHTVSSENLDWIAPFSVETKNECPRQLYYFRPYRPGQTVYPLPTYIAGTQTVDLDREVDNFHINNIQNGLAPSLAITTFTNASEEQREENKAEIESAYGGTNNAGALIYMDVADPALAPIITPIPQNGADGYYTTLNEMTTQKILTAHRISSPMLLGIRDTGGGLGNNADEIETAHKLFLSTVIEPLQQEILRGWNKPMNVIYPGIDTKVIQKNALGEDGVVETTVIGEDSVTNNNIQ
jgi:hypothetical protein